MYGIVYKATNLVNNKVYIGCTINTLEERMKQHFSKVGDGCYFHNALGKYGKDNFRWDIIDYADTVEELSNKEVYWIDYYQSFTDKNKGYNSTSGGEISKKISEDVKRKISAGNKGKIISEETREKLSKALSGRIVSEETKKKQSMALSGKNNPMFGKKLTDEQKKKIGQASLGHKLTQEAKDKIGRAHKGKIVSDETREKLSRAKAGTKLPPFSKEHIEKLREMNKGAKNPSAKQVICIETKTIYGCIQEAAKETNIHYKKISRCCNGDINKADDFTFKFFEESEHI